jgi:choline dehydrogenase-like flavoprotein
MSKVLGGGSSINVMVWARGHKSDWDFFASESGDSAWSYESVLGIYRRIEDCMARRRAVSALPLRHRITRSSA